MRNPNEINEEILAIHELDLPASMKAILIVTISWSIGECPAKPSKAITEINCANCVFFDTDECFYYDVENKLTFCQSFRFERQK